MNHSRSSFSFSFSNLLGREGDASRTRNESGNENDAPVIY